MIKSPSIQSPVLVVKSLYLILYAGLAAWSTYFYVYLKDDGGLSGVQIGLLASVQQFMVMLFLPLWGLVADKYGKRKIFLISLALSLIFLQGFLVQGTFVLYLVFVILVYAANSPLTSLLDSIAIELSSKQGTNTSYGELRLWASIGWAVSSAVTGYFVKQGSMIVIFPVSTTLLLITWCISYRYYRPGAVVLHHEKSSFKSIGELLLGNKRLMAFFVLIQVFYILNAPIMLFINLYYNEIGATNFHIGIAIAVQALCELPFFFWGRRLVEAFGAKQLILFAMLVAALRMLLYSMISNPWFAIAVGASHGITLGLFMVAIVAFAHGMIPTHLRTTGQALIYTFLGMGTCIGNFLIGYMKDAITIKNAMIVNAMLVFVLVLATTVFLYVRKKKVEV